MRFPARRIIFALGEARCIRQLVADHDFGRDVRGRTEMPKIVDWYMNGRILIDPMITHVMGLDRIDDAFDLMARGESIRSVIVY